MEINCEHEFVEDEFYVCIKCGLTMNEPIFFHRENEKQHDDFFHKEIKDEKFALLTEIIFKLNLPLSLIYKVHNQNLQDTRNNLKYNEKTALNLYSTLIEMGNCARFKDICDICNVKSTRNISKFLIQKTCVNREDLFFKLCRTFELKKEEIKQLKESMKGIELSGHNEYTIIGAYIYYCFPKKFLLSEIGEKININPVSIKRYFYKYIKK